MNIARKRINPLLLKEKAKYGKLSSIMMRKEYP